MSFVLGQTKASFVVVPGTWRGYDYAAMAQRVAGGLTSPPTTVIIDHGLPEGDPSSLAGAALPSTQRGQDRALDLLHVREYLDPKGVRRSDGTLGTVAAILVDRLRMRGGDRIAMVFPFAHIGGSNLFLTRAQWSVAAASAWSRSIRRQPWISWLRRE